MKKIFLFFIVFSIGASALGYSWNITNKSNQSLDVQVCTTPGIDNCQETIIPAGQGYNFDFNAWYNTGLLLGQITVQKPGDATTKQVFTGVQIAGQTQVGITSGGSLDIHLGAGGYSFSNP